VEDSLDVPEQLVVEDSWDVCLQDRYVAGVDTLECNEDYTEQLEEMYG
jgi:hypothetical protein